MKPAIVRLAVGVMAAGWIGCQRSSDFTALSPGAKAAATEDYRTLALDELRALLREKLGSHGIVLEQAGPNSYKGAIPSPDSTVMLPLEVTVEAQRITCVTKTPAGSTRHIITPQGLKSDLDIK